MTWLAHGPFLDDFNECHHDQRFLYCQYCTPNSTMMMMANPSFIVLLCSVSMQIHVFLLRYHAHYTSLTHLFVSYHWNETCGCCVWAWPQHFITSFKLMWANLNYHHYENVTDTLHSRRPFMIFMIIQINEFNSIKMQKWKSKYGAESVMDAAHCVIKYN